MPEFETVGIGGRLKIAQTNYNNSLAKLRNEYNEKKAEMTVRFMQERDPAKRAQMQADAKLLGQSIGNRRRELQSQFAAEQEEVKMFHQPSAVEPDDPIKALRDVDQDVQRLQGILSQFDVLGPRPKGTHSSGRKLLPNVLLRKSREQFDDPGGTGPRVMVKEQIGYDDKNRPVYDSRLAEGQELRDWAAATASLEKAKRRRTELLRNRHIRARNDGSAFDATGGGTFDDKINATKPKVRESQPDPTPEELKRVGTREAYNQGKRLGYWE
jgi:hypothetical protein